MTTPDTWHEEAKKILDRERHRELEPLPREYCGECDGTGWVEGGKYLQTDCARCSGSGWEP